MTDGESLDCKSFDVQLPFKRDNRPQLAMKSVRTIRIELDGNLVERQYDLLGRFPSIDFKVFEDDYDKVLDVTLTVPGLGFKMDNNEEGVLDFSYTGAVPTNNSYILEVEAKDTKGQSTKATINVELVQKNGDIAPVFSSIFDGDREFEYGPILKEGEIPKGKNVRELTLPIKEFGGYNPANNKKFKFTPKKVALSQWDYDVDQQSLFWLPDYSTIDDVWDEKPQKVKINFVIANDISIRDDQRDVTFIANVLNQTEPENLKLYVNAKASYEASNNKAYDAIKRSLCYLSRAAAIISRKNGNIAAIEASLNGIGEIATIAASTNPWVVGLKSASGIIVSNIKETNRVKTEDVKNLILAFNKELEAIEKKQTELYTLEQSIGNFITKEEATKYSKLSEEYSKLIRGFEIKDSKYTSVITAFRNKKDREDISECR